ncbi:MAG: hypothetical protein Q8773_01005 [Candidatus Phytoplasma australasiaticum]|nr:hypothetical protein [Candidatus Phytoplasma australasiaticum]
MFFYLSYFKIINIFLRLKINFYYLFNVFNKTLTKSKTVQGDTDRLIAFYSAIYLCCFIYNQPPSKPDKQVSKHPAFHNLLSFEN